MSVTWTSWWNKMRYCPYGVAARSDCGHTEFGASLSAQQTKTMKAQVISNDLIVHPELCHLIIDRKLIDSNRTLAKSRLCGYGCGFGSLAPWGTRASADTVLTNFKSRTRSSSAEDGRWRVVGLWCFLLTHCGLVTPYGDIDLGQRRPGGTKPFTWTNFDLSSARPNNIHLRSILQEIPKP